MYKYCHKVLPHGDNRIMTLKDFFIRICKFQNSLICSSYFSKLNPLILFFYSVPYWYKFLRIYAKFAKICTSKTLLF